MSAAFTPTDEQREALRLFSSGVSLAIEAGAGAAKTTTLRLLAESTPRRGQYVAFNRSIVNEAGATFPSNVNCSTIHSLAFRSVGKRFRHRLNAPRMKSTEIARQLKIDPFFIRYGEQTKVLQPSYLGGLVMRTIANYCNSADPAPTRDHVPYIDGIDVPTIDGKRTWENNRQVRDHVARAIGAAWQDLSSPTGSLRFSHDCYLKIWERSEPMIAADFVMMDEAQDSSPVMASIVLQQRERSQIILVGDANQAIYEWRGAVDAFKVFGLKDRATLTKSFRFGPEIAKVANSVLERLDADLRIEGAGPASVVGPIAEPECILTRTNAVAVELALKALADHKRVALVGGAQDVVSFAKASDELREKGWTSHPELACFESWQEVLDYTAYDEQGGDLRLLVKLIEDFGTDTIIRGLGQTVEEGDADLVISTAHKAKGREWPSVQLAGDFDPAPSTEGEEREAGASELRLLYVAATRAKLELDVSACKLLGGDPADVDAKALTALYGTRSGR